MRKEVLEQIDGLVETIYSVDKAGLDEGFSNLINRLSALLEENPISNISRFNEILLVLENAYRKKDLVELADALSYDLKPLVGEEIDGLCCKK